MTTTEQRLRALIRTIPDFPKPGIQFRDITTLLADAEGLRLVIESLAARFGDQRINVVAGIESRGFILGAPLAVALGTGFIPIRKAGKLPGRTIGIDYALEYGTDQLELHVDAVRSDARVLLVDDLIATGGTALAAAQLIKQAGGDLVGCAFVIDLPDLGGRARLHEAGFESVALCGFTGH